MHDRRQIRILRKGWAAWSNDGQFWLPVEYFSEFHTGYLFSWKRASVLEAGFNYDHQFVFFHPTVTSTVSRWNGNCKPGKQLLFQSG